MLRRFYSQPFRTTDNRDLETVEKYREARIEVLVAEVTRLQKELDKLRRGTWRKNDEHAAHQTA